MGGKGKGQSTILMEPLTTVGQIGTRSGSNIQVRIPLESIVFLVQTPAEVDKEEAEYLRAQVYEGTRFLSV